MFLSKTKMTTLHGRLEGADNSSDLMGMNIIFNTLINGLLMKRQKGEHTDFVHSSFFFVFGGKIRLSVSSLIQY